MCPGWVWVQIVKPIVVTLISLHSYWTDTAMQSSKNKMKLNWYKLSWIILHQWKLSSRKFRSNLWILPSQLMNNNIRNVRKEENSFLKTPRLTFNKNESQVNLTGSRIQTPRNCILEVSMRMRSPWGQMFTQWSPKMVHSKGGTRTFSNQMQHLLLSNCSKMWCYLTFVISAQCNFYFSPCTPAPLCLFSRSYKGIAPSQFRFAHG